MIHPRPGMKPLNAKKIMRDERRRQGSEFRSQNEKKSVKRFQGLVVLQKVQQVS